jgi:UDP-N-acetylglucosamine--N-acetylmuramyl-(pentapeptide) pyrophosphoryl-undecaprenol N-acetylglucosamine transferase
MPRPNRPYRFIISGGGTGGHLFPALSIAHALKAAQPEAAFLFVGALGRMEMHRVPREGYPIVGLWISGIQRSLSLQNLAFPFKVISSLIHSLFILLRFRPDAVIGVGGYASAPILMMAQLLGIPTFLQEQNAYAGLTNKVLAGRIKRAYVAYPGMEAYFPAKSIRLTGNPVRPAMLQLPTDRAAAWAQFGLQPNKPVVFVVGGSLGARTLNRTMLNGLDRLEKAGVQLIWQTGKAYADMAREAVAKHPTAGFFTSEFIDRMDLAFAAADLIVSRAGAGTISELAIVGKPVILVPSPHVAEDHQTKNALALSNQDAALLVRDAVAEELLVTTLLDLLADPARRAQMAEKLQPFALRNAASEISQDLLAYLDAKQKGGKS